jgi:hypothetical protein
VDAKIESTVSPTGKPTYHQEIRTPANIGGELASNAARVRFLP